MRVTQHNGRSGKDGVFGTRHNDRNFNTAHADHINKDMQSQNVFMYAGQKHHPGLTFDQVERMTYEKHFRAHLDERNARQIAARHPSRVQTMDDFRKAKQTCPEETIMQIGDSKLHPTAEQLQQICNEYLSWQHKTFPQVKVLDMAYHLDETTPHLHERHIWIAHDKDGHEFPNQNRALQEMGIERPDPAKPEGRYNNAKMTYTAQCRAKFAEICRDHGLEIETQPKQRSESGLTMLEYQSRQEEQRLHELQADVSDLQTQKAADLNQIQALQGQISDLRQQADEQAQKARKADLDVRQATERLEAIKAEHDDLQAKSDSLQRAYDQRQAKMDSLNKRLDIVSTAKLPKIDTRPTLTHKDMVLVKISDLQRLRMRAAFRGSADSYLDRIRQKATDAMDEIDIHRQKAINDINAAQESTLQAKMDAARIRSDAAKDTRFREYVQAREPLLWAEFQLQDAKEQHRQQERLRNQQHRHEPSL